MIDPAAPDAAARNPAVADPALTAPEVTAPAGTLALGGLRIWPPVVLAPMAGVTNPAFRRICRAYGAGLYVSEMVNARGLADGGAKSCELAAFDEDESPRSIQLYGADPAVVARAVERLVIDGHVDHIDLNFGCPVRKVTRHGGGSAVPVRPRLLAAVVGAAVDAAGPVPVTIKVRLGIDDDLLTYLDAGRVAEDVGAAAISLHARTAAQLYSGRADWSAIARLKRHVTIPVLGNGDIWTAADALALVRATGADGVVVGRGCLGRPWLFRDLADAFDGRPSRPAPNLGEVVAILTAHAELLVERRGEEAGLRDFRKHTGWYLTGYPVGRAVRQRLTCVTSMAELVSIVERLDPDLTAPAELADSPRGTRAGPQSVTLPSGWRDHRDDATPPTQPAALMASGG